MLFLFSASLSMVQLYLFAGELTREYIYGYQGGKGNTLGTVFIATREGRRHIECKSFWIEGRKQRMVCVTLAACPKKYREGMFLGRNSAKNFKIVVDSLLGLFILTSFMG